MWMILNILSRCPNQNMHRQHNCEHNSEDLTTDATEGIWNSFADNSSECLLLEWGNLVCNDSTDLS